MDTPGSARARHQSLRAHARNAAAQDPAYSAQERLRFFAFSRFLARVFADQPDDWGLKGTGALLARIPVARASNDLDLVSGGALSYLRTDCDRPPRWTMRTDSPLPSCPGRAPSPGTIVAAGSPPKRESARTAWRVQGGRCCRLDEHAAARDRPPVLPPCPSRQWHTRDRRGASIRSRTISLTRCVLPTSTSTRELSLIAHHAIAAALARIPLSQRVSVMRHIRADA